MRWQTPASLFNTFLGANLPVQPALTIPLATFCSNVTHYIMLSHLSPSQLPER